MIPEFALRLICGLSLIWCLAPRKDITSGYFRIQMLIVLGLSVLMGLTASQFPSFAGKRVAFEQSIIMKATTLGILAFLGSFFWTLERRTAGGIVCFVIATLSTLAVIDLTDGSASSEISFSALQNASNSMSSAFLFGSVTAAMLLGHWYLTATGMKLAPMIRLNQYFLAAVLIRIVVAGMMLATGDAMNLKINWVLLALRWAGLIGPFILSVLTISTLRYRNTQSATGVLYAATILVFMGEMADRLLEQAPSVTAA